MIYNPQEEFDSKLKELHADHVRSFFEELVRRSGVVPAENQKTVKEYYSSSESLRKLKRKLGWLKVLRVILCITILLIPVVIFLLNPKIKALRAAVEQAEKRVQELLAKAWRQMQPLNELFTDDDALRIMEKTVPQLSFAPCFSAEQESDMRTNYDFGEVDSIERSAADVLAGHYNDTPFLFERRLIHRMGTQDYHGFLTISWTETYRDKDGRIRTRVRTQTLHATVVKPKPFYSYQTILHYCAQGGPELSFSRTDTKLENKSERGIERYVKRGERKLKKKTDKAIRKNEDFVSMSNTEFEVLFGALDRDHEVQFRSLFTPLAQTNMVDLILAESGYQDDFHFIKRKRANQIISEHAQGRPVKLYADQFRSFDFDVIKTAFQEKNAEFFRSVYFDFAPLWAIPAYQERPVHSLKPLPDGYASYASKEHEAVANAGDARHFAHPASKTQSILKARFVSSREGADRIAVHAYSYDIAKRVAVIPVLGGDGRMHGVPVPWDEYLPLEAQNTFFVGKEDGQAQGKQVIARHNGLCIYQ